ncbi:Uncharacterized protein YR821_1511 [Yersinia ruckeri]|uniref:Uncharacterized protein n=1 Tax=Yersinia ruckeri TaxID=29486 RepID=A0A0A8VC62_YERRU|nr:hypothetical protein yruck0001_16420 [Yersinia ruckeri ATCC 29473]QTD76436.1 Uncharacterized protein YR821_1511 [Yersinia ruckeri]CEK27337.1 hypothetical protein CSF007_7905 [Yersinia ruckeri]
MSNNGLSTLGLSFVFPDVSQILAAVYPLNSSANGYHNRLSD